MRSREIGRESIVHRSRPDGYLVRLALMVAWKLAIETPPMDPGSLFWHSPYSQQKNLEFFQIPIFSQTWLGKNSNIQPNLVSRSSITTKYWTSQGISENLEENLCIPMAHNTQGRTSWCLERRVACLQLVHVTRNIWEVPTTLVMGLHLGLRNLEVNA